jgi:acetoin utilization deacetylase AcuC-like enzyme
MARVLLAHDTVFGTHQPHPGHPEQPARLEWLNGIPALESLPRLKPRPATREELLRVHSGDYLDAIRTVEDAGGGRLDVDTPIGPGSLDAALHAAGTCVDLILALLGGEVDAGIALVRPPGHHARPCSGMGFCILNNAAVAAAAAVAGGARVAVFDWDVHHGNGIQEAFWTTAEVLYASMHQHPHYPFSGAPWERGEGPGEGTTLNVPLPAGCRDADYAHAVERLVAPALRAFAPDVLIIAAGFDAHHSDPFGQMALTGLGFASLLEQALDAAGRVPVLFELEGGYTPEGLRDGVGQCMPVLRGAAPLPRPPQTPHPTVVEHVTRLADTLGVRG